MTTSLLTDPSAAAVEAPATPARARAAVEPVEAAPAAAPLPAAESPSTPARRTLDGVDAGGTPDGAADAGRDPGRDAGWAPPSWDDVVRTHSARVYRLAYRLTGNAADADDLTQDVFVRVFRSLDSYTPGTFEGWLHRITTNLFLDGVRRKQRVRFEALPEDAERIPGRAPNPAQVYEDTHLDPAIQTALDALPPDFRAAVVLCDIEGLSYEEIAATLGIKLGTVRSRIHRGRAQLRAALADRHAGGGALRLPDAEGA